MKHLFRTLLFLALVTTVFGAAGDVEIRERNSSNRTTVNALADPAGDRILVIDDSNAAGSKVEGAAIGSGLSFDGTTLSATAGGATATDLAGGTALSSGNDYYDTFSADRTNMTLPGAPTNGDSLSITFDVTGATRSLGFSSATVYRLGEAGSSTGPWSFPVGNHKITLAYLDSKWVLVDSAVDSETANTFLAAPDGSAGPMSPRAIVDADIPAAIARDSEVTSAVSGKQDADADLDDLADGTLSGSKVGTGIDGTNITTGTVADARVASTIARDSELPTKGTLGLDTTDKPTFANVVITASAHTYAASMAIDFNGNGFRTVTLTGNVTFTTSNRAAGRSVTYKINPGASARTPTFPAGWVWIGATPTTFTASKIGILTVTCWGTADTDVTASYNEQP